MVKLSNRRNIVAVAVASAAIATTAPASGQMTQPVCDPSGGDISGCCFNHPNPVFIAGTSAAKSALQAIATNLPEISIIWGTPDSCIALSDLVMRTAAIPTSNCSPNPPPVTYQWLKSDGSTPACLLSPSAPTNPEQYGEAVDIAVSDTFPSTCQDNTAMGAIGPQQVDVLGPIQAQGIAEPNNPMSPSAISADAAYVVFGFDAQSYVVAPWGLSDNVFIRPYTSGTLNVIGQEIGLPATKWENSLSCVGQVQLTSLGMYEAIATGDPESAIGILASQFVRLYNTQQVVAGTNLKILGFQAPGQSCGYLPDATQGSGDKLNVRQGLYPIWGPAHLVANVDDTGNPDSSNPHYLAVTAVLNAFIATGCEGGQCPPGNGGIGSLLGMVDADSGISLEPSPDLQQAVIQAEASPNAGVVPWCAMQVTRGTVELGPEQPYRPTVPCGCAFESWATPGNTVSTYCRSCNGDNDCKVTGYPHCRYNFCEAQ